MSRLCILLLLSTALASSAPAQVVSTEDVQRRIGEIDAEIADFEGVARKIRGENHRVILGGTVGDPQFILVSAEQAESLFLTALLNGTMTPATAAGWARRFGQFTREFLQSADQEIQRLRESRQRLVEELTRRGAAVPPPASTPPLTATGSTSGRWSAACSYRSDDAGAQPSTDGGTFSLAFDGRGGVSGSYQGANGSFGVTGSVGLDGSASGSGAGDGWSVNWSGSFQQTGGAITGSGGLSVAISAFGGGSCTGTWAVP